MIVLYIRLLFFIGLIFPLSGLAQTRDWTPDERELKAAMLLNFGKFASFPSDKKEFFALCILGQNYFGKSLDMLRTVTIGERRIEIKLHSEPSKKLRDCNVLFIGIGFRKNLEEVLKIVADSPTISVGEMTEFARRGGTINLINEGSTIRMRINKKHAFRSNPKLSSRLLRIATLVD